MPDQITPIDKDNYQVISTTAVARSLNDSQSKSDDLQAYIKKLNAERNNYDALIANTQKQLDDLNLEIQTAQAAIAQAFPANIPANP